MAQVVQYVGVVASISSIGWYLSPHFTVDNNVGNEGATFIGERVSACPQMTALDLSSKFVVATDNLMFAEPSIIAPRMQGISSAIKACEVSAME